MSFLQGQFGQQKRLWGMLLLATVCCMLLVTGRIGLKWHYLPELSSWKEFVDTRGLTYIFLIWNLLLAWIPYLLAMRFEQLQLQNSGRVALGLTFVVWLLFLPNAPYIITDFLHLKHKPPVPLWYDLSLLFAFASTGLLLGLLSLHKMHYGLQRHFSGGMSNAIIFASIALSGFGIWLGRFQRWNSWDIFARPDALLLDLADTLSTGHELLRAIGVSVLLSSILLVGYGFLLALIGHPSSAKS